jgi:hypothetical protein
MMSASRHDGGDGFRPEADTNVWSGLHCIANGCDMFRTVTWGVALLAAAMLLPSLASAADASTACAGLVTQPIYRLADVPLAIRKLIGPMSEPGGTFHQWKPPETPPEHPDKRMVLAGQPQSGVWVVVYDEEADLLPLTHLVVFVAPWPRTPSDTAPLIALRTETSADAASKLCKAASALIDARVWTESVPPAG